MLKTNKIVSLILAVVLVFSMFTVAASAAEGDDAANTVTVDGVKYEVNVGDTFTYYYYLNVSEITQDTFKPGRIINIEGSTYYDDSIIKVTNWVEDEDGFYSDMFPVLYNAGLVSNQLDDEMTYNASNLNGIRFDKDGRAVIKMDCEVIAEGSTEINTIIKNSQKFGPTGPEDDLVIVIEDGVFKAEPWAVKEEVVGLEPPATEAPTDAPATEAPTDAPATEAPTDAPVTEAPTEAFDPADHTWTAVGAIAPGHVDGGIFGTAWTPANTANDLTFDEATGLWSITYTDVAATGETEDYDDTYYEYKVAADHAWDLSFNDKGNALGDGTNAQFDVAVDGSTVTIFFDGTKCWAEVVAPEVPTDAPATEAPTDAPATEAPTDAPATEAPTDAPATEAPTEAFDPADHTWTAVGAIAPGHVDGGIFGTAWTPANTDNDLTFDEATGLWSITYTDVAATGETEDYDDTYYEYKVAADHAWDLSFNDKGNALGDGTNAQFDVAVDGSTVTIFFDGTKCWAEVVAPEVPTETEAPTDAPATEAPTDAPANDLYIRLENDDNQLYPVVKGEKYRYTFYMTVPAKIGSFDASTWYDVDGLKVCPIVDEYGDDDLAAMFPGFAGNVVANLTGEAANGEILYNHSSVGGFRFNDEKAVFTVDFEVTADTGIFDIWTQIRTVADTDMNKYYQYGEKLMDGCEFRSDLNGYFPTPDTQAPATEAPTDAPVTEAPTDAPVTEAPTDAPVTEAPTDAPVTEAPTEAPKKVYIRVDNDDEKVYEVETGKTYTYEYFLACDQKISSLDCTTWFDTEGLDFVPAVDEYGDPTGTEMPNLPAPVYNYDIDGEILYNFSNVAGVRFPVPADGAMVEKNVVFRGQFTVTAEEGVYDIWTDLKVLGDTNNDKIIFGSEQVNPDVTVIEEERIADLVPGTLPEIPTDAPATEAPTDAPVTEAPTDAPATDAPEVPTDAPATDAPEVPTDAPATEAPTDAPEQPEETEEPSEEEPSDEPVDEPDDDATADEPGPATSGQSSTGDSKNPANSNAVKTGSTAAAIAFLTVLVMAAGVVMFARKRKFN